MADEVRSIADELAALKASTASLSAELAVIRRILGKLKSAMDKDPALSLAVERALQAELRPEDIAELLATSESLEDMAGDDLADDLRVVGARSEGVPVGEDPVALAARNDVADREDANAGLRDNNSNPSAGSNSSAPPDDGSAPDRTPARP